MTHSIGHLLQAQVWPVVVSVTTAATRAIASRLPSAIGAHSAATSEADADAGRALLAEVFFGVGLLATCCILCYRRFCMRTHKGLTAHNPAGTRYSNLRGEPSEAGWSGNRASEDMPRCCALDIADTGSVAGSVASGAEQNADWAGFDFDDSPPGSPDQQQARFKQKDEWGFDDFEAALSGPPSSSHKVTKGELIDF